MSLTCLLMFSAARWIADLFTTYPTASYLLASIVFLLNVREDSRHHHTVTAVLSVSLAAISLVALLITAITHGRWLSVSIGCVALCVELWFVKRWWLPEEPV